MVASCASRISGVRERCVCRWKNLKSENLKIPKVTVNAPGNGSMTLVTDLQEQVTAAFSAELSQSNGITDKNDIGVEKLIVSAERTQDLVTGWVLGCKVERSSSVTRCSLIARHLLQQAGEGQTEMEDAPAPPLRPPHLNLGYMRLFA